MDYRERPTPPTGGGGYYVFGHGGGGFRRWPPGIKGLILTNVAVFLFSFLFLPRDRVQGFVELFGVSATGLFKHGRVWQLATYAFLHDTEGIGHVLFNMLFLFFFGRALERNWGTKRFLFFYFSAAVFAGLAYVLWQFVGGAAHPERLAISSIGASGAVMAVMMVYALWYPNQLILLFFIIPMRIRTLVILTVIIEVVSLPNLQDNVAHMAHLGGLLFGFIIVRFGPQLRRVFRSEGRHYATRVTEDDERRLDDILQKVSRSGIGSLSWGEKRFLKKMSERR